MKSILLLCSLFLAFGAVAEAKVKRKPASSDACSFTREQAYAMASAGGANHEDVDAEAKEIYESMQARCQEEKNEDGGGDSGSSSSHSPSGHSPNPSK